VGGVQIVAIAFVTPLFLLTLLNVLRNMATSMIARTCACNVAFFPNGSFHPGERAAASR